MLFKMAICGNMSAFCLLDIPLFLLAVIKYLSHTDRHHAVTSLLHIVVESLKETAFKTEENTLSDVFNVLLFDAQTFQVVLLPTFLKLTLPVSLFSTL